MKSQELMKKAQEMAFHLGMKVLDGHKVKQDVETLTHALQVLEKEYLEEVEKEKKVAETVETAKAG